MPRPPPSRYGRTIYLPRDDARPVFLRRQRMTAQPGGSTYDEAWLQDLLFRCPEILPIGELDEAFGPAIPLCRELETPAGPIDNAYVNPSGRLTLVECKLWRNPEARRKVIAQILDYAKELNRWSWEDLDQAVRRARKPEGDSHGPFDLVRKELESPDEASFVDGVTRNLASGRFLLLVVGDGIREDVERIAGYLRQFTGILFTFGLVELALLELPTRDAPAGLIVEPRILARTVEIERGVIRMRDGKPEIAPPPTPSPTPGGRRPITEDEFYREITRRDNALPDRLRAFFERVEDLGLVVSAGEASLMLHWFREDGKKVNFGTLNRDGTLNTNFIAWSAAEAGDIGLAVSYHAAVSKLIPGSGVLKKGNTWSWRVVVDGRLPRFADLLDHSDEWLNAIRETMEAWNRHAAD